MEMAGKGLPGRVDPQRPESPVLVGFDCEGCPNAPSSPGGRFYNQGGVMRELDSISRIGISLDSGRGLP